MLCKLKNFFFYAACVLNCSSITADSEKWHRYIDFTVGERIYYLYDAALDFHMLPGKKALILGSGAGNEDVDLLRKGWEVWSVDQSIRSKQIIEQRAANFKDRSHFYLGDFSSLKMIGNYDLVMSFFALPFGDKEALPTLLKNISNHMPAGGVFAVTFFGENHDFVKKKAAYGMKETELKKLFTNNNFEINYLLHRIYDKKDAFDNMVHWDMFDVVAVKQ